VSSPPGNLLACSFTNFYLVLCQLAARKHVMTCPIREYVYRGWGVSLRGMLACSFTNFYFVLCQLAARKHVMTCPIREYVYMGAGGGVPSGSGGLVPPVGMEGITCILELVATRGSRHRHIHPALSFFLWVF